MARSDAWGWILAAMLSVFFLFAVIPFILSIIGLRKCTNEEPDKTLKIFAYVLIGISAFRLLITVIAVVLVLTLGLLAIPTA